MIDLTDSPERKEPAVPKSEPDAPISEGKPPLAPVPREKPTFPEEKAPKKPRVAASYGSLYCALLASQGDKFPAGSASAFIHHSPFHGQTLSGIKTLTDVLSSLHCHPTLSQTTVSLSPSHDLSSVVPVHTPRRPEEPAAAPAGPPEEPSPSSAQLHPGDEPGEAPSADAGLTPNGRDRAPQVVQELDLAQLTAAAERCAGHLQLKLQCWGMFVVVLLLRGALPASHLAVERVAVLGAEEVREGEASLWSPSQHCVFRALADVAAQQLGALQVQHGPGGGGDVLRGLLRWLGCYRRLFQRTCASCGRLLAKDPHWHVLLPPVYRELGVVGLGMAASNVQAEESRDGSEAEQSVAYHLHCWRSRANRLPRSSTVDSSASR